MASDCRPISLINGIQKIISKTLVNRIDQVLTTIIAPMQSAFLKGRLMTDSFVSACELIAWCAKFGTECISIKGDFEKVFDNVRWPYLKSILSWLGFSNKW